MQPFLLLHVRSNFTTSVSSYHVINRKSNATGSLKMYRVFFFLSLFIFSGVKFSYWGLPLPRLACGTNFRAAEAPETE